jgi:hypothetical protein
MENKPKSFKEYYQNPEFKKKHLEYIMSKVQCTDCGAMCSRCNLTKHKKSVKHLKHLAEQEKKEKETKTGELNQVHEAFLSFIKIYHDKVVVNKTT